MLGEGNISLTRHTHLGAQALEERWVLLRPLDGLLQALLDGRMAANIRPGHARQLQRHLPHPARPDARPRRRKVLRIHLAPGGSWIAWWGPHFLLIQPVSL